MAWSDYPYLGSKGVIVDDETEQDWAGELSGDEPNNWLGTLLWLSILALMGVIASLAYGCLEGP